MAESTLYIVSTPIGNLGDMTPRAIETLRSVHLIAAEDTRHSSRLMQHFDIKTPMWACHDHNERAQADRILQRLSQGENIALISDAGTPLISDPGYHLVRKAREAGYRIEPVPGACAFVTALSASGLPTDRFQFEGFLPAKSKGRLERLEQVKEELRTLIYYESPHRLLDTLQAMIEVFGEERYLVLARELTKTFETIRGDSLAHLKQWVESDPNQQRGEFVLMVHGAEIVETEALDADSMHVLTTLLEELPLKQAVVLATRITGLKKKLLYQTALDLKED
ncbi:MAG: 16S rRNA (cytidine(1402)-2'-O)-methyltransferase [Motiliproteus sp.]|nr:16S rRNA (cytidine(1402)-2'-O)-methyltransferase [Motiliproteus sp.]